MARSPSLLLAETQAVELLARNSINDLMHTSHAIRTFQPVKHDNDDRAWNLQHLRKEISKLELECLYQQYSQRLENSHISIFLLLHTSLAVIHIATVLFANQTNKPVQLVDFIGYSLAVLFAWPLLGLLFYQRLLRTFSWMKQIVSSSILLILIISDITVPLYHWWVDPDSASLRVSRATFTILTCHLLLPVTRDLLAMIMGGIITASHLVVLALITHRHKENMEVLIAGDAIYLLCANALCFYFRFIREILLRRIFLDRRACLETTEQLKYEQEQEERLMLSILPDYVMKEMKTDIRNVCTKLIGNLENLSIVTVPRSPFRDIYVEEFFDVSILYADVVNYTQMTTRLGACELVETLNELFGHFDKASERHNVMRIKFLGDCYYCVSGIPEPDPNHAQNCVDLGLEMITIIGEVRKRRSLDVDMRIGVHSGNVISGVLGAKKWQYDIWSKDVKIANVMESTGAPGKVHVSRQTLNRLNGMYRYEPAPKDSKARTDPLLVENCIETFLISKHMRSTHHESTSKVYYRQQSPRYSVLRGDNPSFSDSHALALNGNGAIVSQRRTFMNSGLRRQETIQQKADEDMMMSIDELPIGDCRQFSTCSNCAPLFMIFHNISWELPYIRQNDPLFKFYVAATFFILLSVIFIQRLSLTHWNTTMWIIFMITLVIIIIVLILSWTLWMWNRYDLRHRFSNSRRKSIKGNNVGRSSIMIPGRLSEMYTNSSTRTPKWKITKFLYKASEFIMVNAAIRSGIYCGLISLTAACSMINLHLCEDDQDDPRALITSDVIVIKMTSACTISAWFTTHSVSLVLMMTFMFYKIHYLLKLLVGLTVAIVYLVFIWFLRHNLYMKSSSWNTTLDSRWAHSMTVGLVLILVYAVDRQCERVQRLDFRWKHILHKEREGYASTHIVNKMLLENILPKHVAEFFLNSGRDPNELYYKEYPNVAVLFASITGVDGILSSGEEAAQITEKGVLGVLNKIICAFDALLFENRAYRVEKIKMSGWTYMAACGLDLDQVADERVALILAEFAADMISALRIENRTLFQNFKLRIGIDYGGVTAGVVGAKKPLYDIWGHTVNMAARLDTTGVAGKIQVTDRTAQILDRLGVLSQHRGETFIKGKGMTTTYFVKMGENDRLLKRMPARPIQPVSYVTFEDTTVQDTKL